MMKSLSVFFPFINEEGNVEATTAKAIEVLKRLKIEYEIILVNDGSTDKTAEVIERLAKENSRIKAIHHPKNLGYGEALKSGFYNAKYDTIVYTDGDGQFDFAEVTKFIEEIEKHDLLIGYRIKRQDPLFRILFKKGWSLSLFTMFGLTLKDVDCGFKMIKRSVLEKIPHLESQRGAMINAELAIKAKKYGFKVGQVGVNHYPRLSGKPTGASLNVIIRSYLDLMRLWWKLKDQKFFFILLISILALAAFLRFYKIDQYMLFLGDEGRDALIVREMVEGRHFPLIGPPTSVGNIYLGPLYYYMMMVPMFLFYLSPVAASAMNALIGVLTVLLVYYLAKEWFGRGAALISSFLYAISPITINYSKFSWNPNPAPFFSLLLILSLYRAYKLKNYYWYLLSGFALAAAIQMHYLCLILVPIVLIIWRLEFKKIVNKKNFFLGSILGFITFLIMMSPLVLFDLRHNFLNFRAVTELFSKQESVKADLFSNFARIPEIYSHDLVGRYIAAESIYLMGLVSALILVALVVPLVKKRSLDWPRLTLFVWLVTGLLGLSFYQRDIYDHYLGFLNPVPFLLLGSLVSLDLPKNILSKVFKGLIIILVAVLAILNFQKSPLNYPPNNQLQRSEAIAQYIIQQAGGADFNFALLAENNYDSAYVFFLETLGHSPKKVPFEKTEQLFVVCEDPKCDPTHSPKYELAAFGWSKIEWMEEFQGVKIYKLVPNPTGKP